jgi:ParB/RepB/Spo0J family partition protein
LKRKATVTAEPNPRFLLAAMVGIAEPPLPVRQSFDPDKLAELAASMKRDGLINPIALEENGDGYTVMAGHRRFLAARINQWELIPARVWRQGTCAPEAILAAENAEREDVNPAEEAMWLGELLEGRCNGDVDQLCELVHMKRSKVEGRVLLLTGDEEVFRAVQRGEINLAVAAELNRYDDELLRRMRLDAAAKGGATARMVREWRLNDQRLVNVIQSSVEGAAPAANPQQTYAVSSLLCSICGQGDEPHRLRIQYIHDFCEEAAKRFRLAGLADKPEGGA